MENTVEATERVVDYPLSDSDINHILKPPTNIMVYSSLELVNDIDEIFDSLGRVMLLYPVSSESNGHWVCMIKRPNEIEFFDPYGKAPDTELKWMSSSLRRELNLEKPVLTRLFDESEYKVVFNTYKFQEDDKAVNTCGRHCIARLMYKDLSLDAYKKLVLGSGLSPDEFVAGLTYLKLNK
jgi:hypothetical protein